MFHGTGIEIALASHSCETEEVLVFEVTAIAPAHDLESDEILLSRLDETCQVKLTCQFRVFAVTHETTIDIQGNVGSHRAKVSDDLLPLPRSGHKDLATIASHAVLFGRRNGRIVGVVSAPSISEIQIQRVTIAIEFPKSRYGHFSPRVVVIAHLKEVLGSFARRMHEVESPKAMQREVFLLKRSEVGMHWQSVDGIDLRILPCITWPFGKKRGCKKGDYQR